MESENSGPPRPEECSALEKANRGTKHVTFEGRVHQRVFRQAGFEAAGFDASTEDCADSLYAVQQDVLEKQRCESSTYLDLKDEDSASESLDRLFEPVGRSSEERGIFLGQEEREAINWPLLLFNHLLLCIVGPLIVRLTVFSSRSFLSGGVEASAEQVLWDIAILICGTMFSGLHRTENGDLYKFMLGLFLGLLLLELLSLKPLLATYCMAGLYFLLLGLLLMTMQERLEAALHPILSSGSRTLQMLRLGLLVMMIFAAFLIDMLKWLYCPNTLVLLLLWGASVLSALCLLLFLANSTLKNKSQPWISLATLGWAVESSLLLYYTVWVAYYTNDHTYIGYVYVTRLLAPALPVLMWALGRAKPYAMEKLSSKRPRDIICGVAFYICVGVGAVLIFLGSILSISFLARPPIYKGCELPAASHQ
jgi:hypothetical protein